MSRGAIAASKIVIVVIVCGLLLAQLWVFPQVVTEEAWNFPEFAHLYWPAVLGADGAVACVEVALVCVWRLLTRVARDQIFDPHSLAFVTVIFWADVVATGVAGLTFIMLVLAGAANGGVFLVFGAVIVGGTGIALLLTVMRSLLVQATAFRAELAEVI